jgi:carboxyl-terminal processing protease
MVFFNKYTPIIFILGICLWFFIQDYHTQENIVPNWGTYRWKKEIIEWDVFRSNKIQSVEKTIQNEYYHFSEKSKEDIENGMIHSLVESLWDKHSSYFPPQEAKEFAEVLNGDFEWIWAVIDEHIRWIIIRKIFDTSPAKKAGLQDGDIILKVWEESMLWLKADEAVKKIRWPKWSKVNILYSRWESGLPKTVEVTRDTIVIPSTQEKTFTWKFLDIGYIDVAFFGERTPIEFQKSLEKLTASWAKALILDFRNNGWGYLDSAVDILSYLLPDNTIAVTTKENDPKKTLSLSTKSNKFTNTDIPVIMLINNLSASSTEIVAWALKDYKRAIIIGEQSYGKWSVQQPFVLNDGSIIKLTIAKWYTPKDVNIDHSGITPDIFIPLFDRDFTNRYDRQLENAKEIMNTLLSTNAGIEKIIEDAKGKDFSQ